MKMKRGLMRQPRTTRDFSSHEKPAHMNQGFWHSCDPVRGAESTRHRSLGTYLHLNRLLKVATFKKPQRSLIRLPSVSSSPDRRATVTSKSICKLSGRNNILPSIEDEWPTFLVRYSHLILPLSPLTVALTDYTWQRLDEGRWRLGACLLWRNKHLNGCS